MIRLYLFVFILVFQISCGYQKEKNNSIKIYKDKKCIALPGNQLNLYLDASANSTYFYGYNNFSHQIDVFDLENLEFKKSIKLSSDGPEAITNIETFDVIDDETIFIKESIKRIHRIKEGNIESFRLSKNYFQEEAGFEFDHYSIISNTFDGFDFDTENKVYFPLHSKSNNNQICRIDFERNVITLLPILVSFPVNLSNYGDKMYPNIEIVDNEIFFNYNFSSKVYSYNTLNRELNQYNIKSNFTENETPPLGEEAYRNDISKRASYHLNELNFFGIRYDKFRDLFYRVHQDKRESSDQKQELYFTVISRNLTKLSETKLPEGTKPYFEITKKGIYFPFQPEDESYLCFLSLCVKKINSID